MNPSSRKSSPKARSGSAENHDPKNGASGTRKPSTRVKGAINYDEKQAFIALKDELDHPVEGQDRVGLTELEERAHELEDSWETESLFEDALNEMTEDHLVDYPDACTPEEAVQYRQLLRSIGPDEFCKRTIDAGIITVKKLLTAFNIKPPEFLEGLGDDVYLPILSLALSRELSKRAKLTMYNTVDDVVSLLEKSKNIIVLTGAGISTSLGIPDFRSKGGLYSQYEHLGLNDPQEIFDIEVFKRDPNIFYTVARDVIPSTNRFSPTHAFIALLEKKGKLLTNYSQNIDNIEEKAGVSPEKLIQCHGSFATATCMKCKHKVKGDSIFPEIAAGQIPRCKKCAETTRGASNKGRKRKMNKDGTERKVRRRPGDFDSNSDSEFDSPSTSCGVMKPDITFFGEKLPDEFESRLAGHDRNLVDLVIVIGTSLKVAPVSEVSSFLPPQVPQIYISRTPVSHINFDVDLLGDCDIVVSELCRRAGWTLDHDMIPRDQKIDVTNVEGFQSRHVFTQTHPPVSIPSSPASSGTASGSTSDSSKDAKAARDERAATRENGRRKSAGIDAEEK